MPTSRARHMITETDEIAAAIDASARIWPDLRDDRAALLRLLISRGAESVNAESKRIRTDRRAAIRDTAGTMRGVYPPGEAARLREEWPE